VSLLGPTAGLAFTRVTALYERARFGGTPPTRHEAEEAEASLATLGARTAMSFRPPRRASSGSDAK
jgi:Domain of unknown function (DUF4129)